MSSRGPIACRKAPVKPLCAARDRRRRNKLLHGARLTQRGSTRLTGRSLVLRSRVMAGTWSLGAAAIEHLQQTPSNVVRGQRRPGPPLSERGPNRRRGPSRKDHTVSLAPRSDHHPSTGPGRPGYPEIAAGFSAAANCRDTCPTSDRCRSWHGIAHSQSSAIVLSPRRSLWRWPLPGSPSSCPREWQ